MTLYLTSACSLCDQALALLTSSTRLRSWELTTIDIADSQALEEFADRIPVVEVSGRLLDWPFTADQVAALADP